MLIHVVFRIIVFYKTSLVLVFVRFHSGLADSFQECKRDLLVALVVGDGVKRSEAERQARKHSVAAHSKQEIKRVNFSNGPMTLIWVKVTETNMTL